MFGLLLYLWLPKWVFLMDLSKIITQRTTSYSRVTPALFPIPEYFVWLCPWISIACILLKLQSFRETLMWFWSCLKFSLHLVPKVMQNPCFSCLSTKIEWSLYSVSISATSVQRIRNSFIIIIKWVQNCSNLLLFASSLTIELKSRLLLFKEGPR